MMFMTAEQRKKHQAQVFFGYFCKFLCVILSAVALWQGFIIVSFWLLALGLLG